MCPGSCLRGGRSRFRGTRILKMSCASDSILNTAYRFTYARRLRSEALYHHLKCRCDAERPHTALP